MIPQQILDVLAGEDVLLIPPAEEGVTPIPAEDFAAEHLPALMALGMAVARDGADTDEQATFLLFNPEVYPSEEIEQLAHEGRLAEYVNGFGNGVKPVNPQAFVKVTDHEGGPVRDILVETAEQAKAAVDRNVGPKRNVEIKPLSPDEVEGTLRNRIQRVGAVPNPVPLRP